MACTRIFFTGQAQRASKVLVSNWSPDDFNLLINAGLEVYMRTMDDQTQGLTERNRQYGSRMSHACQPTVLNPKETKGSAVINLSQQIAHKPALFAECTGSCYNHHGRRQGSKQNRNSIIEGGADRRPWHRHKNRR